MHRATQTLFFKFRWWRWFLARPNDSAMDFYGFDQYTRDILQQRWRTSEPKMLDTARLPAGQEWTRLR
jgi:hypothetical protein